MIATQYINSTTSKPIQYEGFETVNVLKWNNSKWKSLCPYYLRTDGHEQCVNPGNVLFENFYQGLKVYDIVYENAVYPSRFHSGKLEHLWWNFKPINSSGDNLVNDDKTINYDLYFRWRDDLWNCQHPIRYPNKMQRKHRVKFGLYIDHDGNETRLNYLDLRKKMYMGEYIRLIRKLPEYSKLLNGLKKGKNIMICEVDVSSNGKKGEYGLDCDDNNMCILSTEKVMKLLEDTSEPFGHGLCLAYALLEDMKM